MSEQKYYMFHGKDPKRRRSVNFHHAKKLIVLGKAIAVEYETDKEHGGGDGRPHVWRHKFDKGALVCMDEKCRNQIYIIGNKIRVTDAGIEH